MNEVDKIKKELKEVQSRLNCLLSLFPAATQWSPYHTISNGYKYKKNTIVWHEGCIYRAKQDNSGANITDPFFWEKVDAGYLLAQEQADWNAIEGPSFIRNKPPGLGGEETDPVFNAWLDTNPLSGFLTSETDPVFTTWLAGNPLSGYLTFESDPVFQAWLALNPFSGYATESWVNLNYYSITNPSGYITSAALTGLVPYIGATANVNLGVYGLSTEYIQFNTSPTTYSPGVGKVGWNDTDGTLEFKLKGGNVTLQIGQEQVARVVNKTTPLINLLEANYQVCVISGATGQRVSVRLAQADNDANSAGTLGVVTENINANQEGFITTNGQVKEIDTTGSLQGETWNDGDILYLSPTIAGAMTNIKPIAPNHTVIVGYVEYAHAIHGKIFVKIDNGYELDELHNVKITSLQNEDVLMYNSTDTVWENKNPFDYFDAKPVVYQKHVNMPAFNNSAINNIEGTTLLLTGGVARLWTNTNIVTKTQRIGLVTATTGNIAQIRQVNNYLAREDGFNAISGFNMAENATDSSVRFFIGLSTLTIFSNVEANTLLNCAGFCKLTTSNNVNIVHNDNTGTATTIDLGVNFPANTISTDKYFIYWATVPTGIYLKIVRVGTIYSYETILTTDIPATTTALNFGAYIVDSAGASVSTGADWYGTYIRVLS